MSNAPSPGLRNQPQLRNVFRVAGILLFGAGVVMIVLGFMALFSTVNTDPFTDDSFGPPKRFFLAFVGMPVLAVGAWCLQAGFMGVASRYVAGEGAPVLKDSVAYLTDGEGLLGVGRTVDDAPGKFCQSCGNPAGGTARFCESCGHAFA
jgi:hypothetical protein